MLSQEELRSLISSLERRAAEYDTFAEAHDHDTTLEVKLHEPASVLI